MGVGTPGPTSESLEIDALADEIARLEIESIDGSGSLEPIDAMLAGARAAGDNALIGRTLSLRSRLEILGGRHGNALRSANTALDAFAALDARTAHAYTGPHAETYRAAATALIKVGRVSEALPMLERAIAIAESGIGAPAPPAPRNTSLSPQAALVRSLVTLGVGLFAIREIDAAIETYDRAIAAAAAHSDVAERFLDDVMLARWNLTDALHERAKRRRAAGDEAGAATDITAAQALLDDQTWSIDVPAEGARTPSPYARAAYFSALGHHLLITARPADALATFERQLHEIGRLNYIDDLGAAEALTGMGQASLALNAPQDALERSARALDALDRHDESNARAAALRVRAEALRALGRYDAAYEALEAHHAIRARLEAIAAQQYASHMTARVGLERARAEAESHRQLAEMLETLGQIGQEITANLDADAVFRIVARHVDSLLGANALRVWLLDSSGERLTLVFRSGTAGDLAETAIALGDPGSAAARAARERQAVIERAQAAPDTLLLSPLVVGDRVLGVVSIASDRADAYTENERSIFRTLGTYAAIALDNAGAYTKLEQTVKTLRTTQLELREQTAEFERLSMTDTLTGVANRRQLNERAQVEIATLRRKGGQLSVAMFDLDHFKRVNDTHGHAVGDAVLQRIALVAKEWLRPVDLISRVGGEEFALLLPGVGLREAIAIAERIRSSIADTTIHARGTTVRVSSSFGVAAFQTDSETLDAVLSRADAALYAAKQAGRDRVRAAP